MAAWKSITGSDARAFLDQAGTRRTGVHALTKKIFHWLYCANCGLVALKNDESRRALKRACTWED